jgi:hypothetical protein
MDTTKGTFLVNKEGFSFWSATGEVKTTESSSEAPKEI